MFLNKVKLRAWFRRVVYHTDDSMGPCVRIVIRQVSSADGRRHTGEVFRQNIEHNKEAVTMDEDEMDNLINEIELVAQEDAEGCGGIQQYAIYPYFLSQKQHGPRFVFRMTGAEEDYMSDESSGDTANMKGQWGQILRHNEALMRTAVIGANQTIGLLNKTITRLELHNEKLLDDRARNFELMEELRSKQHERELLTIEAQNHEERMQSLFESAKILMPVVVNKLAGKQVMPEVVSASEEMISQWVQSLSEGQVSTILPQLLPHQQIVLLNVIEKIGENAGTSDEKKQKQLPGNTDIKAVK